MSPPCTLYFFSTHCDLCALWPLPIVCGFLWYCGPVFACRSLRCALRRSEGMANLSLRSPRSSSAIGKWVYNRILLVAILDEAGELFSAWNSFTQNWTIFLLVNDIQHRFQPWLIHQILDCWERAAEFVLLPSFFFFPTHFLNRVPRVRSGNDAVRIHRHLVRRQMGMELEQRTRAARS